MADLNKYGVCYGCGLVHVGDCAPRPWTDRLLKSEADGLSFMHGLESSPAVYRDIADHIDAESGPSTMSFILRGQATRLERLKMAAE